MIVLVITYKIMAILVSQKVVLRKTRFDAQMNFIINDESMNTLHAPYKELAIRLPPT